MKFSKNDQIEFLNDRVNHQAAGGFVFYESASNHILYVALLQKADGKFYIPKGHILINEKPKQAAIREVKEELAINKNLKILGKIGTDSYSFILPDDKRTHYKNVYLYVFELASKDEIKPLGRENFLKAEWIEFNKALKNMAFDGEKLLKAKQFFYSYKLKKNQRHKKI